MVRKYFTLGVLCVLLVPSLVRAQVRERQPWAFVKLAVPDSTPRQDISPQRPLQTRNTRVFFEQAEIYLRDHVAFYPPPVECAAMQLTFSTERPYFAFFGGPALYPTKCDTILPEWMSGQVDIDSEGERVWWLSVRQWWWQNEMPKISAQYGYSPAELLVWFQDTARMIWDAAIANRTLRELHKVADPYLADMRNGKVMPAWLGDGQLNERSHRGWKMTSSGH